MWSHKSYFEQTSLRGFDFLFTILSVLFYGVCNEIMMRLQNMSLPYSHSLASVSHHRVEFALHPQHETSCDPEIQIKEDLKRKFRKKP